MADWLKHNRLLLNVKKSNTRMFKWKYQLKIDLLNNNIDAIEYTVKSMIEGIRNFFITEL